MAEAKEFRAIRGVRDILPPDTALWNWFEQIAREVMEAYNYREIRLPIFEQTELFARSIGAETDVVSKEMYSFEDHDLSDLARLRSAILLWESERPIVKDARWFATQLRTFQTVFQRVYDRGEVPRTSDNDWARQLLLKLAEEIDGEVNKLEPLDSFQGRAKDKLINLHIVEEGLKKFGGWAATVNHALNAIKLGDEVTLRPEATASVVRAYIEHGMHTLPGLVKLYYLGPMFRRERPQKGRYRQFYQIGAEVLGQSDHPAIDAELVEMLIVLLERCRLERWTLLINSIGCGKCRPKYVAHLREALLKVKDKLGPDSQRRIETNPLRVLDSKLPEEQPIIERLPRLLDYLCDDCRGHFAKLQEELKLRGIAYEINWRLVRGLDYYMRTTFEIISPALGAQNALVGGGRYDGLSELLGGPPAKGIGFALGTDRFIEAIKAAGKVDASRPVEVFIAWIGAAAYPVAVKLARLLRAEDFTVEVPPEEMKLKKSLGLADKLGARYALLLGEDEIASGSYVLRRLADGEQKELSGSDLLAYLKSGRSGSASHSAQS